MPARRNGACHDGTGRHPARIADRPGLTAHLAGIRFARGARGPAAGPVLTGPRHAAPWRVAGGMVVNFIAIRYGLVYEMAATGSPVVGFRT
ncbi:hypothetical protein RAA17_18690 [Komagataeibacter rhaeticus]|nr:hypothetical protein [Komagataeibacter rhaeticus]